MITKLENIDLKGGIDIPRTASLSRTTKKHLQRFTNLRKEPQENRHHLALELADLGNEERPYLTLRNRNKISGIFAFLTNKDFIGKEENHSYLILQSLESLPKNDFEGYFFSLSLSILEHLGKANGYSHVMVERPYLVPHMNGVMIEKSFQTIHQIGLSKKL